MGQQMGVTMGKPLDLLRGRKTYEIFAAYGPHASDEQGAGRLNRATKYVVTSTRASGARQLQSGNVVRSWPPGVSTSTQSSTAGCSHAIWVASRFAAPSRA